ncbi:hypothetical protein LSAT2_029103 [Lamellibrachia satsuma]|nr:hypothetical protein LSAT2_029103 [Lamellibrachia satsuma]
MNDTTRPGPCESTRSLLTRAIRRRARINICRFALSERSGHSDCVFVNIPFVNGDPRESLCLTNQHAVVAPKWAETAAVNSIFGYYNSSNIVLEVTLPDDKTIYSRT